MTIRPLSDHVLIRNEAAETTTTSGIVLPESAAEKPAIATVVAVGPGGVVEGKEVIMNVKAGDRVVYSKYAGREVKIDEDEYTIVRQNDILAVVED